MVLVAPPGTTAAWHLMTMLVRRITNTVLDFISSNPTSFFQLLSGLQLQHFESLDLEAP